MAELLQPSASMQPLDVLTVGEAMALFAARTTGPLAQVEQFSRSVAGAELNVAIGLSRLGLRVGYVSRVGADMLGDYLLSAMEREGIDRRYVQRDPQHATGLMFKSLEESGRDPTTQYFRKGSAASHMGPQDVPTDVFHAVRRLHITGISAALSGSVLELVQHMLQQARAAEVPVSFDPNLRPSLWSSKAVMMDTLNALSLQCDLVMPGLEEGRLLTGKESPQDIAAHYLERGVKQVVIKLGPSGAYFANPTEHGNVDGFLVQKVVDTVGAGDGFAVGVISGLLDGLHLRDAALRGNAIGARVVQFPGDNDGLPTRAELASALAELRVA